MISFILLVLFYLIPCICNFISDIKNGKSGYKWILSIVLLTVAVYIKSIGF